MKKKFVRLLTMILAMFAVFYTGCASSDDEIMVETQIETVSEALADDIVVNSEVEESVTEFSVNEAIAVAESAFKAMKELDAEEMVKYINMEVFYYIANGQYLEGEKLADALTVVINESSLEEGYNSLGIVGQYASWEGVKFYDVQPLSADELNSMNDFITSDDTMLWGEKEGIDYNIENAYNLKVKHNGLEEGSEPYVLVVYANGEWKMDICVSVMKDLYDALMNTE